MIESNYSHVVAVFRPVKLTSFKYHADAKPVSEETSLTSALNNDHFTY